jgi:hypothetical protein
MSYCRTSQRYSTMIVSAGSNHRTLKSLLSLYNNHHHHRSIVSIVGPRLLVSCPQNVIRPTMFHPMPLLLPQPLPQQQQQRSISYLFRSDLSSRVSGTGIRSFSTLPPHEIVGLPSLSPVRFCLKSPFFGKKHAIPFWKFF